MYQDDPHVQFGIDEVYVHQEFAYTLLEKLQRRAVLSMDHEDIIVHKHVTHDMVLVFHKKIQSQSMIYKFLRFMHEYKNKDDYIQSNTLLNEDELFAAISTKSFVLVTPRVLMKEVHVPLQCR